MQNDVVSLVIDGKTFKGWTAVRIMRSIDTIAGTFELTLTNAFQLEDKPLAIKPGLSCILRAGEDTLLTGYIDDVMLFGGARQAEMRIAGRDKAADLVDCTVTDCPSVIRNNRCR